jgi:hypothetical protein
MASIFLIKENSGHQRDIQRRWWRDAVVGLVSH